MPTHDEVPVPTCGNCTRSRYTFPSLQNLRSAGRRLWTGTRTTPPRLDSAARSPPRRRENSCTSHVPAHSSIGEFSSGGQLRLFHQIKSFTYSGPVSLGRSSILNSFCNWNKVDCKIKWQVYPLFSKHFCIFQSESFSYYF